MYPTNPVRKIFHFADIHIRCGEDETCSRLNQYLEVFRELQKFFSWIDSTDCIAVIVGDIFHMKGKADVFAITMLNNFINSFPEKMPVYIVRGNHDVVQQRPKQPDLLEALLQKYPNVTYIKSTKSFRVNNLGFSVVDIMDVLEHGTSSGKQIDELPEFPKIADDDVDFKVALFHGTIIQSKLQNYSESTQGVPLEWFSGFDLGLFGDVHLQQIHADDNKRFFHDKLTWAYPGSLIQQNFGEEILNHGLLEWNFDTKKIIPHNLKCPHGFLKVKLQEPFQILNSKGLHIEDVLTSSLCPEDLSLRIYGEIDTTKTNSLKCLIESHGKMHTITRMSNFKEDNVGHCGGQFIENSTIVNFNTKSSWISHIEKDQDETWYRGWKDFICEDSCLPIKLPSGVFSPFVEEKVSKKNQEFKSLADGDTEMLSFTPCTFKIRFMDWAWVLCYGESNHVNFEEINSYTTLISGQNAVGKTSFLECILIGLFGETSPGKSNSLFSGSIIHHLKPKNDKSYVTIEFQLDANVYTLYRSFRLDKDSSKIKESEVKLCSSCLPNDLSGNRTVNEWIKSNICPINEFLQSVMLCQSDAKDFFHMTSAEQLSKIECSQSMDAVNNFSMVLDSAYKTYNGVTNFIEEIVANELSEMKTFKGGELENMMFVKSNLESEIEECRLASQSLRERLKQFESQHLQLDNDQIQNSIYQIKEQVSTYSSSTQTKDELLVEKGKLLQIDDKLQKLNISHIDEIDVDASRRFVKEYNILRTSNEDLANTVDTLTQELNEMHNYENSFNRKLRELSVDKDFDVDVAMKTRKKLLKLIPEKNIIEKNLSKLESCLSKYDELQSERQARQTDLKKLQVALDELVSKRLPFNPECEACNKQPWNLQKNDLQSKVGVISDELMSIEKSITSMESTITDKRNRYQKNSEQYNFILSYDIQNLDTSIENYNFQQQVLDELTQTGLRKKEIDSKILESRSKMNKNSEKLNSLHGRYKDHQIIIDSSVDISKLINLRHINKMLDEIEKRDAAVFELEYWTGISENKHVHQELINLETKLVEKQSELQNLNQRIEIIKEAKMKHDNSMLKQTFLEEIRIKSKTLEAMSESFKFFRKHIFNDLLLPYVCNKVNALVSNVSSNNSLNLTGSLHTRKTKTRSYDEIEWKVNYDGSSLPIEKASGFQRAILSFAMVITLNSINTKIKNDQLFVDEGFVHFDGQHLSRVFDLLNGFRSEYSQIILVSHLDELKHNANMCIEISRTAKEGFSTLSFGARKNTQESFAKKRGRPKKVY